MPSDQQLSMNLLQYSQHREFYYQISETEKKKNLFIGVSPVPFSNVSTHLFIFCSSSLSLRQFSKGVYFACVRNEGEGLEETQSDREKEGGREREREGDVRACKKKHPIQTAATKKPAAPTRTAADGSSRRRVPSPFDATRTGPRTAHICVWLQRVRRREPSAVTMRPGARRRLRPPPPPPPPLGAALRLRLVALLGVVVAAAAACEGAVHRGESHCLAEVVVPSGEKYLTTPGLHRNGVR